ncbi:hypothetical protein BBJ28_00002421 [Nothophytophthora sp. Chile5]|nr:hypothetical protein BBJ28_00002421 [Nothophytophthora sp. Chile5]
MIFDLLDIMSNFGVLQLNPDLFEPEVKIIFNVNYVNHAMLATEYEIAGKFLQCMKLFGRAKTAENANLIAGCENFLVRKQLPNGSWSKLGGTAVDQYKATVTCANGGTTLEALMTARMKKLVKAKVRSPELYLTTSDPKLSLTEIVLCVSKLEAEPVHEDAAASTEDKNGVKDEADTVKTEASAVKEEATTVKEDANTVKEEANTVKEEESVLKEEESVVEEEAFVDSTTDSEDVKAEHKAQVSIAHLEQSPGTVDARENEEKTHDDDDDDVLTNMSLNEDLEIFDGLKFEDGGGIIDVSLHPMEDAHDEEADDDVAHDDESAADDADGTDAAAQDDDEEEEEEVEEEEEEMMDDAVYDDDNDEENGHSVTEDAHVEDIDAQAPSIEADTADPDGISLTGDFDT